MGRSVHRSLDAIWAPSLNDGAAFPLISVVAPQRGENSGVDHHPSDEQRKDVEEGDQDDFHVAPATR